MFALVPLIRYMEYKQKNCQRYSISPSKPRNNTSYYTLVDGYATPASEAAPAGRELSCLKLIPVHAHDIVRLRSLIRVPNDDDHSCRLRNFTCDDVPSETLFFR